MSGPITARRFLIEYAERSNVTPEELFRQGMVVATCTHCDYEGCEGWQVTTQDIVIRWGQGDSVVLTAENFADE